MASDTIGPPIEGIWKRGSVKLPISVKPCWTQEGTHAPTSFRSPLIASMALRVAFRQSSMAALCAQLQSSILYGCFLDLQSATTMLSMEYWSQGDSMIKSGAFRYFARFAALKQWQGSSKSCRHCGMGYPAASQPLSRMSLKSDCSLMVCILTKGEQNSVMKSPLSGRAQTLAVLVCSNRQLEQRQVAMPPADTPVITMESPLQKSNCWSRQRNCSRVLLYPRKQSCLSLQEMGTALLPVYSLPSQYITQILVQSQKTGLSACLVESNPYESKLRVGVAFLVEPRLPLVRWQQLSRVSAMEVPSQKPPLLKQIMYLFRLAPDPRWQQRPVGVPSRQAAPLYWECRTRVQRLDCEWTLRMTRDIKKTTLKLAALMDLYWLKAINQNKQGHTTHPLYPPLHPFLILLNSIPTSINVSISKCMRSV